MAVLVDARGNELTGPIDLISGNNFVDSRTLSFLLGSINAETIMELNGQTTVMVDSRSNAFVGTLSFQATIDAVNWFDIPATSLSSQATTINAVISGASANQWVCHVGGYQAFRVRMSAYSSGNLDISVRGSIATIRPSLNRPYPTQLWITVAGAANAIATATLPAAGVGLFHYITHIDIMRSSTAAVAGTAILTHTSTNLPGSPAWSFGNAIIAGGTEKDLLLDLSAPLKSSVANTATTIVAPAPGAAVQNRINVGYFVGA